MNYIYINRIHMGTQIKNMLDIDKLRVFQNFEAALTDIWIQNIYIHHMTNI